MSRRHTLYPCKDNRIALYTFLATIFRILLFWNIKVYKGRSLYVLCIFYVRYQKEKMGNGMEMEWKYNEHFKAKKYLKFIIHFVLSLVMCKHCLPCQLNCFLLWKSAVFDHIFWQNMLDQLIKTIQYVWNSMHKNTFHTCQKFLILQGWPFLNEIKLSTHTVPICVFCLSNTFMQTGWVTSWQLRFHYLWNPGWFATVNVKGLLAMSHSIQE